jgi:hypothetical protein
LITRGYIDYLARQSADLREAYEAAVACPRFDLSRIYIDPGADSLFAKPQPPFEIDDLISLFVKQNKIKDEYKPQAFAYGRNALIFSCAHADWYARFRLGYLPHKRRLSAKVLRRSRALEKAIAQFIEDGSKEIVGLSLMLEPPVEPRLEKVRDWLCILKKAQSAVDQISLLNEIAELDEIPRNGAPADEWGVGFVWGMGSAWSQIGAGRISSQENSAFLAFVEAGYRTLERFYQEPASAVPLR